MSLEAAVYSYLTGQSAVSALIDVRLYPGQAPQGAALPYVTQTIISERRYPNLASASGLVRSRLQLDVFAATLDSAESVYQAIRAELDGWRNAPMGDDALNVLGVNLDDRATDHIAPQDSSDQATFRIRLDFVFQYGETVPTF